MSKTPYFRTRLGKQHVTGFETVLKSPRHNYYQMFPWISDKFSWKKSALVRSEILRLFVNTLTGEYRYSGRNMQKFPLQNQAQLSQKQKAISKFFIAFLKYTSRLEHFEKKYEPSSLSIPEINDPKWSGTYMSKRSYFRTRFVKTRFSRFETLLEPARQHYYRLLPWIWDILSWKDSFLVRPEILGLFVNTLTAEYQYSRRSIHNFPHTTSNPVISETKNIFGIFYCISKMYIKFRTFWKKR